MGVQVAVVTFCERIHAKGHGNWRKITAQPDFPLVSGGFCGRRDFLAVRSRNRSRKLAKTVTYSSEIASKSHGSEAPLKLMEEIVKFRYISDWNLTISSHLLHRNPIYRIWG